MSAEAEKNIQKIKRMMTLRMSERNRIVRDSKYGQFIVQTNEVQYFLIELIILKTKLSSKKLFEYLEKSTLGNLINCFRICADLWELPLIESLESYNNSRNALAHKMYTEKKLTEKECESAVKLGEKILIDFKKLININLVKK